MASKEFERALLRRMDRMLALMEKEAGRDAGTARKERSY
jgi:hypothetical protein